MYDFQFREVLQTIRTFTDTFENLQPIGRNGMHRYNNRDHSMLATMMAVKNRSGDTFDLWKINEEQSYHEEFAENVESDSISSTQRAVPERINTIVGP